MSEPAVSARALVKRYPGAEAPALDGVDVDIARGEFFGLLGVSGSGKSTFLNLVGALDVPTSGSVRLNGRDLAQEADLDAVRAREVGFVFQLHNLIPTLTSTENVEIPMIGVGVPRRERRRRAAELLESLGLGHRLESIATRLSGGERQRVSIARALANGPSVVLADEPTGDVDRATGERILEGLLEARRRSGATLVVVTHNPEILKGADRVATMKDGRLA
jgi:putative ABC transport system ATP-binding protein